MNGELVSLLGKITQEEQAILDGRTSIDRAIYMLGSDNTIQAEKLLAAGKLITLRPHTRFIHFPEHTHNYVEVVYMCRGETTHIVNGNTIHLRQGELLFMNQGATHEIYRAERDDIAVNFIVLPHFFAGVLKDIGEEETPLRRFLVECLCGYDDGTGYLHFQVNNVISVQNLIENLLLVLMQEGQQKRKKSQLIMTLLFLQLMECTQQLKTADCEQEMVFKILSYVESDYAHGSLTELADILHYDICTLSREIKRRTGKTYTQLVQEKRLAQAAFLLRNTDRNVDHIANAVGYENIGYFHRIFRDNYGVSPKEYRLQIR